MQWHRYGGEIAQATGRRAAEGICRDCKAWVLVETHPAPNGIDIGGPAVAQGCGS